MKSLHLVLTLFSLSMILSTPKALGAKVTIKDSRCVTGTLTKVHSHVTNYDAYSTSAGATYEMDLGLGTIEMLSMIKSQSGVERNNAGTTGSIWVVMRPLSLTDSTIYPKFLLKCISSVFTNSFSHQCQLGPSKHQYGLDGFNSNLEASTLSTGCLYGQVRLNYTLTLISNDQHVQAIKEKSRNTFAGTMWELIGPFFDENTIFQSYYENFYDRWIQEIR